jgi:hypothetical protein
MDEKIQASHVPMDNIYLNQFVRGRATISPRANVKNADTTKVSLYALKHY